MMDDFRQALIAGVERLTAWADLLDRINVFPIADGDTGRNLLISLAPLRHPNRDKQVLARDLLLSARGNSGNIASQFFQSLFVLFLIPFLRRLIIPHPPPGIFLLYEMTLVIMGIFIALPVA